MKYKRDRNAVRANFEVNKARQVVCRNKCSIQVPKSFFDHHLGVLGSSISIYGLFAVILETGQYALVNTTAMFRISPSSVAVTKVDDEEYYEFFFDKNTVVFPTTGLLSEGKLIYEAFNSFFFMGRVPWYVSYEDHCRIFDTAPHFAGFGSLKNPEVIELLSSMCARKAHTTSGEFLRLSMKDEKDGESENIEFVPMGSVIATVHSSLNKISGAYAQDGIISAIVSPSDTIGSVEKIVRA